ncbi:hypothetical protein B9Z55_012971 [Caenorhabditis nigoni]|uniref:Uncharacterized protein n=1 Tax=Caenorhabditis nigoni TaxID=1611254 RepID=A0A2G5TZP3_9PELO|nr:hypothetical protein B9Z55_012971 [Caenorhabditis nigoni]
MSSYRKVADLTENTTFDIKTYASVCFGIFFIVYFIWWLSVFIKSRKLHKVTKFPKQPDWLLRNTIDAFDKDEQQFFTIYVSSQRRSWIRYPKSLKYESKNTLKKMRNLLERNFEAKVDVPDTTHLFSIPMKNFRSGELFGTFDSIHGGPPDSFYEYQMIGDDRIQVAYFVVNEVRYVAGICIYFLDPYQHWSRYRESMLRRLLKSPVYWNKYNLKEDKMEVMDNGTLRTINRYGEVKSFRFNGKTRRLDIEEPREVCREVISYQDLDELQISICMTKNQLVTISEKHGIRLHAYWDHNRIQYFKCPSCAEPDDDLPPSYQWIQDNQKMKNFKS